MNRATISAVVDASVHAAAHKHAMAKGTSVSKWLEELVIDELKRLYGSNFMPETTGRPVSFVTNNLVPAKAEVSTHLGRETLAALNKEAAKRGLKTKDFIEKLLDTIVEGNLFLAVLDDEAPDVVRAPSKPRDGMIG